MTEETEKVHVTEHAYKRMRERMRLDKKASERMASLVRDRGVLSDNTYGRLKRYMLNNEEKTEDGATILCYGEFVYVFSRDQSRLITVYTVPTELRKNCIMAQRKQGRTGRREAKGVLLDLYCAIIEPR
jgi:hypothetical protein